MTRAPSSAPALVRAESSASVDLVRHVHQGAAGPSIAKIENVRVVNVQVASIGEAMVAMRKRLGLSQDKLALRLGLHVQTLRKYERDELQMDRAEVFRQLLLMCERLKESA